jgi:hypothetical protein
VDDLAQGAAAASEDATTPRTGFLNRIPDIPNIVWEPIAGTAILLVPLAFAFAVDRVWLFPSLGPTAYFQATTPRRETSRFYNIMVGHMTGVGAAFLALHAIGAVNSPSLLAAGQPVALRMWAALLAMACTLLLNVGLRSYHPPAAGTALFIAIGAFPATMSTVLNIFIGVLLVAVVGDVVRRLRLGKMSFSLREEIPWHLPFRDN